MNAPLIEATGLTKEYRLASGKKVHAVSDVSLQIFRGETLGLVGESGCGKSTLGRALIGLNPPTAGEVRFEGAPITGLGERAFRAYRRRMQMIFQDPYASLDPRMTVQEIVAEPLKTYKVCKTREELSARVGALLDAVGIPREYRDRYPHQFSGGQRQRVGIARAIALRPGSDRLRRAGLRAGRIGAESDSQPAQIAAARAWADVSVYQPRSVRRAVSVRSRVRDVFRLALRAGRHRRRL